MTDFADKPKVSLHGDPIITPDAGTPNPAKTENGQYKDYWVLPEAERAKGFVRPFRDAYQHIGPEGPKNPLRDLTEKERERYSQYGYAKYETYPVSDSSVVGKYWTEAELQKIAGGCGTVTRMGRALSETYARDPEFYGSTFCCTCGAHFPVKEFVWVADNEVVGS